MTLLAFMIALAAGPAAPLQTPAGGQPVSRDCRGAVPAGFTRIYIGLPAVGARQSGSSYSDPLDGSTAEKFDAILRSISEGKRPALGAQKNIRPENLIVCLGRGTFQTNGQYDWRLNQGHAQGKDLGFTVEKNWRIHGRGPDQTTLQLASYMTDDLVDQRGRHFRAGRNVVIGTHSAQSSGIEISDLTIDANHDRLAAGGNLPLNLEAIVLRASQGGHWIHNINVIGASGDAGSLNIIYEAFLVEIWGESLPGRTGHNTGSIVEHVTLSNPGRAMVKDSPPGGASVGIVVNNAAAEIRSNTVDGYAIAYGGWSMGPAQFHDNIARNNQYGFNADSYNNQGVALRNNQFIHPALYGIVIGGGNPQTYFSNWNVVGNTIQLDRSGAIGLVLRGQVQNSVFEANTFSADGGRKLTAIWSYPAAPGLVNQRNSFQQNRIDRALDINFSRDPNFPTDCRFQNRDLQGAPLSGLPDNTNRLCR